MLRIAHATTDFQRIAAGRRPRHAAISLALAGGGALALLVYLMLAALRPGHPGTAGTLALLASRANLARLASMLRT
ncbi:MAG: hypothetical protein ACYC97_08425 [Metallibacterium sp.]